MLQHRKFSANAERVDPPQLEIEFKEAKAKLDKMAAELDRLDRGQCAA